MLVRAAALLAFVTGCDFIFSLDVSPLIECPESYTPTPTGTYRHDPTMTSWSSAEEICRLDRDNATGATHLVVISSFIERDGVSVLANGLDVHVGLADLASEGDFRWVTEEPNPFAATAAGSPPWGASEPNNGGTNGNEDCVIMKIDGAFNDVSCTALRGYVCECDEHEAASP
jgi:hypothetical protein